MVDRPTDDRPLRQDRLKGRGKNERHTHTQQTSKVSSFCLHLPHVRTFVNWALPATQEIQYQLVVVVVVDNNMTLLLSD